MPTPPAILLGYGGSKHSKIALAWADDLAAQLSRPLRVLVSTLHVADVPNVPREDRVSYVTDELDELLASAKSSNPTVTTVLGAPGDALVRAATDAYLTVLGARTQGPLKSMVNGSVSQHVARNAPGPVVVVREPHTPSTGKIVVAVDGSEYSYKALLFALRYAKETGGNVLALHAHHQQGEFTDEQVEQVIAKAFKDRGDVPTEFRYVYGAASQKLAEASGKADLMVSGTRGRSAISSLLIGSVTQELLQHSQCPVAVIR